MKSVQEASGKVLIAIKPVHFAPDIRKADVLHVAHDLHHI